ncbi:hypothetical protein ABT083_23145 [Streptomyces goshikiensis]|uniref:hypothetical protein n=1 Tax=Streptomyces goshikiensis TaxID=1942 RepID=UPI0033230469
MHAVLPDWKIWHPLAPDRPQAVIEALRNKHLKPYSIVWLNEMQQYLLPQPDGPKVAAALQNLLADISEGPILLLGTMWPDYWELLVPGADGEGGLELAVANGAVGQLLEQAITITVPEAFTPTELDAVAHLVREDPRLALAWQRASNGQITQFLAGAPTLWRRYEQADAPSQAILHAAIDARRFGHGRLLTEGFLKEAAAGYCKHIWDSLSDNWFELSLNKLTRNYRRLPGPLIRYRLRPDEQPITDDSLYYLADYLEEKGRIERQKIPPEQSLWVASARYSLHPTDLIQLARSAQKLKNENCVDLYVRASEYGDAAGIHWLIRTEIGRRRLVRAETLIDDHAPSGRLFAELSAAASTSGLVLDAERFAKRASLLSDPTGLRRLAYDFAASGQEETAERLYNWGAASNDMVAISWLTRRRLAQGRRQEARRFAEAALSLGFPASLMQVAHDYLSSDDAAEADHLYRKVAELGHVGALRREAEEVSRYRQHRTALHLYRVAARAGDPLALQWLSWHHDGRGEHLRAEELAHSAARLGNAHALHGLAHLRLGAGSQDEARRLNLLAASMGDTNARDWLARNSSSPSDSDDTRMPPPSS